MCSQLCKPHESNKMLWKIKQNLHNKKIIEDLKSQSENNKETITQKFYLKILMKVLIFGGSGRLGSAINKYCEKSIQSIKVGNNNKGDIKINFEKSNIEKLILNQKPTIIINCIALTDVDKCNYDVQKAYSANVQTIGDITRSIKKLILIVSWAHISTDQVYNSLEKKERNFEPDINLNNIYSITKYMGELEARKYKKSLVVRTNFFGNSYLKNKPTYSDYIKTT